MVADDGDRGTGLAIPYCRRHQDEALPVRKEDHSASHRRVRARVEHAFSRTKSWKVLRVCRRGGDGVHRAMLGIAGPHHLTRTGRQEDEQVIRHVTRHSQGTVQEAGTSAGTACSTSNGGPPGAG